MIGDGLSIETYIGSAFLLGEVHYAWDQNLNH
jgi:hypothetical protein